jgi:CheY-like chemotaxis protein
MDARILVVEDDASIRELTSEGLTRAGFRVDATGDGRTEKVLVSIYGKRSVAMARLYPERADRDARDYDAPRNEFQVAPQLTTTLMNVDIALVVDHDPGPLRRRGATADLGERDRLRAQFEKLAEDGRRRQRILQASWHQASQIGRRVLDRMAAVGARRERAQGEAEPQGDGSGAGDRST